MMATIVALKSCQIIWGNGEHAMSQTHNSFIYDNFEKYVGPYSMRDSREQTSHHCNDCDPYIIFDEFSSE